VAFKAVRIPPVVAKRWGVVAKRWGTPKLASDHPLDRLAKIPHPTVHPVGKRLQMPIGAKARIGIDRHTQLVPIPFELTVKSLDLIRRRSAFDPLQKSACQLIHGHRLADQVAMGCGFLNPIGDVLGPTLHRSSLSNGRRPRVSSQSSVG
jgi:hypothetical protein